MNQSSPIPAERIADKIYLIRGKKVMLDRDLSYMYGVETKKLNQSVRRNAERFPEDFMFQLTEEEFENLKSSIVISRRDRMGIRKMPLAFTELGLTMLSCVLNSPQAIAVNLQIIRTFARLRELLLENRDLQLKLEAMESRYDSKFKVVFDAIRQLLNDDAEPPAEIGFKP